MADYPWYDPPERERLVVRLRPGDDPFDAVVMEWRGEFFVGARPADKDEQPFAADDPMVFATPGLIDVQINGYLGRGFKDLDLGAEGIRDLCWSILLSGSTGFVPTITTDAPETMRAAMAQVDAACRAYPDVAAMVLGIHQEGPWISPQDGPRGAHPRQHVALPDMAEFERMQEASGHRIKILTMAPEVEGAIEFIRQVAERGVAVCLGHHNADAETIRRAVEAGARGVTHLGNGCPSVMPRHPNLLWEQAAQDKLYAGIIADGHHLPPATVKVFYRTKPRDRLILVSDAVSMAGAPPGLYRIRDTVAEMSPEGRFGFYKSTILIGAAVPLGRCLANLTRFVEEDKTPADYAMYAVKNPATFLGLQDLTAPLGTPNTPATFVIWRWERQNSTLRPLRIVLRGRTVYDAEVLPVAVPFGRTMEPLTVEEAEKLLEEK